MFGRVVACAASVRALWSLLVAARRGRSRVAIVGPVVSSTVTTRAQSFTRGTADRSMAAAPANSAAVSGCQGHRVPLDRSCSETSVKLL
jgi:hypothetical protein